MPKIVTAYGAVLLIGIESILSNPYNYNKIFVTQLTTIRFESNGRQGKTDAEDSHCLRCGIVDGIESILSNPCNYNKIFVTQLTTIRFESNGQDEFKYTVD